MELYRGTDLTDGCVSSLHLGQGKWHPGQSSSKQSQRSSLLSMRRPLSSYTKVALLPCGFLLLP